MSAAIANLPGPFAARRVIEFEGPYLAPEVLLPDAQPDVFLATKTSQDQRFYLRATNQIVMANHSILVITPRSKILVDTCIGNDKHRPRNPHWHMRTGPFLDDLKSVVALAEIDYVLCTHLHGDHVGWNTRLQDGRWVPTFPRAKYLFGRTEVAFWQAATARDPDTNHGSWADSMQPVFDAGQAVVVNDDHEIEPGVRLVPAPGHTPGNVMIRLEHAGAISYVIGDTMHHPVQIERPEWSSKFCWNAELSTQARRSLLETVADTGAHVIPAHFPTPTAARIVSGADGFSAAQ
ncbi:MAG: MBL fold metallo-hydrolase [Rhodospirillaceae bacterium]|nr:MBL fold metallo-hydrolase [Rhodospirillaceae bacterium]